jgi:tRNA 2-thiouridine synthesizing protein D
MVAPQDEGDLNKQWRALATEYEIELAICIANGLKRGVLSHGEAERWDKPGMTMAPQFELVGLGQLIDAVAESERYVEFPA